MKIKSFLIVFFMSTLMNILYAQDSDRTFPVSDKVTVERVRFKTVLELRWLPICISLSRLKGNFRLLQ